MRVVDLDKLMSLQEVGSDAAPSLSHASGRSSCQCTFMHAPFYKTLTLLQSPETTLTQLIG